jgi:hypothetical protein
MRSGVERGCVDGTWPLLCEGGPGGGEEGADVSTFGVYIYIYLSKWISELWLDCTWPLLCEGGPGGGEEGEGVGAEGREAVQAIGTEEEAVGSTGDTKHWGSGEREGKWQSLQACHIRTSVYLSN